MNINKILLVVVCLLIISQASWGRADRMQNAPDSVFLFPYPTLNDGGRGGMKFVWSSDGEKWQDVAGGQVFVKCDFGGMLLSSGM